MLKLNIGLPAEDSGVKVDYATVDQGVTFTKRLFGYSEPYERFVNIYGDVSYTREEEINDKLVRTINTRI